MKTGIMGFPLIQDILRQHPDALSKDKQEDANSSPKIESDNS